MDKIDINNLVNIEIENSGKKDTLGDCVRLSIFLVDHVKNDVLKKISESDDYDNTVMLYKVNDYMLHVKTKREFGFFNHDCYLTVTRLTWKL
jgi:hypothetical protein